LSKQAAEQKRQAEKSVTPATAGEDPGPTAPTSSQVAAEQMLQQVAAEQMLQARPTSGPGRPLSTDSSGAFIASAGTSVRRPPSTGSAEAYMARTGMSARPPSTESAEAFLAGHSGLPPEYELLLAQNRAAQGMGSMSQSSSAMNQQRAAQQNMMSNLGSMNPWVAAQLLQQQQQQQQAQQNPRLGMRDTWSLEGMF
jgi:hypothetical protein